MELKPFSQSGMRKNLDGHTVRDFSSPEQGIRDEDITIEGRHPERGFLRNGLGVVVVRVLNRHGYLLLNTSEGEKKIPIHNGSRAHIHPNEDYALEGSMEINRMQFPPKPGDGAEYVEYVEEN